MQLCADTLQYNLLLTARPWSSCAHKNQGGISPIECEWSEERGGTVVRQAMSTHKLGMLLKIVVSLVFIMCMRIPSISSTFFQVLLTKGSSGI